MSAEPPLGWGLILSIADPAFKVNNGLEALRGAKAINEVAQERDVHPAQVRQWKNEIQDRPKHCLKANVNRKRICCAPLVRQCTLAVVSRAAVYAKRKPTPVDESDLVFIRLIDEKYTRHP